MILGGMFTLVKLTNNLLKCEKCGYGLIFEEATNHVCKDVLDYEIKEDILWLYDGEIWYPRKLLHQPRGNTENNHG